jgi:hypothetical protein
MITAFPYWDLPLIVIFVRALVYLFSEAPTKRRKEPTNIAPPPRQAKTDEAAN